MSRILFVCLGNICRSPTGEALMRAVVEDHGLTEVIEIDSAGTGAWHVGQTPDSRMSESAFRRGYQLDGRARQVAADELAEWDMVIAMDRENLAELERLAGDRDVRIRLFSDLLPEDAPTDVPDPYYGGPEGFDHVIDLVEQGCAQLMAELLEEHGE